MRVKSVAYSLNGQHIISGSGDYTIWITSGPGDCTSQVLDDKTDAAVGKPLKGYASGVLSVAYSPHDQYIVSRSLYTTFHVWDSFPKVPIHLIRCVLIDFYGQLDQEGWAQNGLLLPVAPDSRAGFNSPVLLTIPPTSYIRSDFADFEDFAYRTSWTRISDYAHLAFLFTVSCASSLVYWLLAPHWLFQFRSPLP